MKVSLRRKVTVDGTHGMTFNVGEGMGTRQDGELRTVNVVLLTENEKSKYFSERMVVLHSWCSRLSTTRQVVVEDSYSGHVPSISFLRQPSYLSDNRGVLHP